MKIVSDEGEQVEVLHKSGIEKACLAENKQKYRQTEPTPGMINPLRSLLGSYGDTDFCSAVLDGSFEPTPQMPTYTVDFFVSCVNSMQEHQSHFFISPKTIILLAGQR